MSEPADGSSLAPVGEMRSFQVAAGVVADPLRHRIVRDGRAIAVEPRVMELLVYLARRPGAIVSKDELRRQVWRTHVVDEAVQRAVSLLRAALGDSARESTMVETVRHRGYRLIVPPVAEQPRRRAGFWRRPALGGLAAVALALSFLTIWSGEVGPAGAPPRPATSAALASAGPGPVIPAADPARSQAQPRRLRPEVARAAERVVQQAPKAPTEQPGLRFDEAPRAPTPEFTPRAEALSPPDQPAPAPQAR